jgi:adenylate kinase
MAQAKMLATIANIDKAILLDVDRNSVVERIAGRRTCPKCGHIHNIKFAGSSEFCSECGEKYVVRSDDTAESVNKRLDIFYKETYPVAEYYRTQGKLLTVDAGKNPEYTLEQIVKGLGKQK